MTLLKEFIKIDVIFDDNEFAKVSAAIVSKITINFNKNKFAFVIAISKTTINFNENEFAFVIIISKKSNVDNFD